MANTPNARIRLAKAIAKTGRASRREAERLIEDGLVTVNGSLIQTPACLVDPSVDRIQVEGEALPPQPRTSWFVLYKPRGYLTTMDDPQGRKTVMELVSNMPELGLRPVGRLDFDTEGVLLFTNDGEMANALTHPSKGVPKRYLAKVWKRPDERKLTRLANGINLEDGRTQPCKVRVIKETDEGGNCWCEITVTEGRNRLIRRMFENIGHPVSKLRRESFGTVSLRGLERGELRSLTADEVDRLEDLAEGRKPESAGHGGKYKPGFALPKPKPNKPLSKKRAANARRRAAVPKPSGDKA